jgi:phage recombination protein Bet
MASPTAEIISLNSALESPQWESKLDLIKKTVANGATNDELELFLYHAKRSGLDPLARQIYFVKRKGRGTIQVGIDGLRLVADRTGQYAGNDDAEFTGETDRGYPAKAKVTVYKMIQGQRCAFSATARWDEYYPGDEQGFQWRKMPHVMLAKCAEALALRKAFPADLSGLYVHEEMEQADRLAPEPRPAQAREEVVDAEVLEGESLVKAAQKTLGTKAPKAAPAIEAKAETKSVASPEGKKAFGYAPERWPLPKMFTDPMTESQGKMMAAKARERDIPEEAVEPLRKLILTTYSVGVGSSKGNASLFIDWLINAEDESIDEALNAVEHPAEQFSLDVPDAE